MVMALIGNTLDKYNLKLTLFTENAVKKIFLKILQLFWKFVQYQLSKHLLQDRLIIIANKIIIKTHRQLFNVLLIR